MMNRWLELVESDYIQTYVADGGSAVKFVICAESAKRTRIAESLKASADRSDLQSIHLDGSLTKLHLIQELFHEFARQVDWDKLVIEYLTLCFQKIGLQLSKSSFPLDLRQFGQGDSSSRAELTDRLQKTLRVDLNEDYAMSHEFRTAILHLCLAQLHRAEGPVSPFGPAVKRWLCGETTQLSEIKGAKLFQKVGRHNARHLLFSLARMFRKIGRGGTFILIDISRYLASNKFSNRVSGHYYTPSTVVDLYELLRQLIDEQGLMEGLFIVVVATPALLSDPFRSLDRYQALKMRIVDDVRVRGGQNLLAPMVTF